MHLLKTVEVYKCENGIYETDPSRVIARELVRLSRDRDNTEINLMHALILTKNRSQVISALNELDRVLSPKVD